MDKQEILNLMKNRANLLAQIELLKSDIKAAKDTILTPEIIIKLAEIDEEFKPALDAAQSGLSSLEAEIRKGVIELGETVNSPECVVIYNNGRESADLTQLKSLISRIPKYRYLLTRGDPYTTIKDKSL